MIENMRHASSAPESESDFRRIAMDDETSMFLSRKRLKIRRIKSSPSLKSELANGYRKIMTGEDQCRKRKSSQEEDSKFKGPLTPKKASILSPSSSSSDQSPGSDVIVAGSSSYISEQASRERNLRKVTCWSHGSISVIGRRREMEDAVAIELGFLIRGSKKYDFFGVYDGHGGSGVAHTCSEHLHRIVVEQVENSVDYDEEKVMDWEKVMVASFRKMDEEVNKSGSPVAMMGSTAVVAVVGEEELVVANCGDSRAVVSRDGVAVALSDDHKPDRADELERIEDSGGKVINWNGQRVLGVLATSRSIGDQYLKPFVISEPEVRVIQRTDNDEFLILACDGLWDVISNDLACQIVRRCLDGQMRRRQTAETTSPDNLSHGQDAGSRAAQAAALLAELAIARGTRDNISVIVIELKRRAS